MTSKDILLLSHGLVSQSLPLLTKRDRYASTQTAADFRSAAVPLTPCDPCASAERKRRSSLPQIPGCPPPAACCCRPPQREEAGKLPSAAGPTCTSWWTPASRCTLLRYMFHLKVEWICILKSESLSQLLHLSLKKSKVTSSEASALEMLDPFVLLLLECLDSMHVKVEACDVCPLTLCARAF